MCPSFVPFVASVSIEALWYCSLSSWIDCAKDEVETTPDDLDWGHYQDNTGLVSGHAVVITAQRPLGWVFKAWIWPPHPWCEHLFLPEKRRGELPVACLLQLQPRFYVLCMNSHSDMILSWVVPNAKQWNAQSGSRDCEAGLESPAPCDSVDWGRVYLCEEAIACRLISPHVSRKEIVWCNCR